MGIINKPRVVRRCGKIVYQTGQQVRFWQVEQSIEHIDARLIK